MGDAGDDLWERASASDAPIRWRLIAANLTGAALVAVVAVLVGVPERGDPQQVEHDTAMSGLLLGAFGLVAIATEVVLSRRRAAQTFGWLDVRRLPERGEVVRVLAFPWVQARAIFVWWLAAAVLNVATNLWFGNNVAYCLRSGLYIALGGLTSSALSFLLLERFNRPTFTLALAGDPAAQDRQLGLQRRLLLTWVLGAAVPVLVIISAPAGMSDERRLELGGPVVAVGAIALAAGLVLTIVASRSITEPVHALRAAQRRVEDGDLDVEVPVDDVGEVGLLQAGFNRMVAGLRERQRIRDLFGRHVGVEVAHRAMSDPDPLGGELRAASVLFVDLIGSTSMTQRLAPEEVVAVLNDVFAVVVRSAEADGGWVNKFEGDAALCVFGPPGDAPDHAAGALRAARRMRDGLLALADQHPGLAAGIGVSTGTVVAGNVGAEDRYEYTVIGDPVNEAARLTELAKDLPGRLVASGSTIAAAGGAATGWRPCGTQTLRGRTEPTELHLPDDGVPTGDTAPGPPGVR